MVCEFGGAGEVKGGASTPSLWTKTDIKRKPVEEQAAGGMTASFAPNGGTFLDTVKSYYGTSGNNCAGV